MSRLKKKKKRNLKINFILVISKENPDDPQKPDTYKGSGPTSHSRGFLKGVTPRNHLNV